MLTSISCCTERAKVSRGGDIVLWQGLGWGGECHSLAEG